MAKHKQKRHNRPRQQPSKARLIREAQAEREYLRMVAALGLRSGRVRGRLPTALRSAV